jgi:hypothetical protein
MHPNIHKGFRTGLDEETNLAAGDVNDSIQVLRKISHGAGYFPIKISWRPYG